MSATCTPDQMVELLMRPPAPPGGSMPKVRTNKRRDFNDLPALRELAADILQDAHASVTDLEWAATALAAEGARQALMTVGRRLEEMVRRVKEVLR